jgi:hypothetical protein
LHNWHSFVLSKKRQFFRRIFLKESPFGPSVHPGHLQGTRYICTYIQGDKIGRIFAIWVIS